MDALVAEDVARRYGDTIALDGVSLRVAEGEIFALVGPNGAGKTTLVRALTGTTDAEGHVEVFGESPTSVSRNRIGLLPQSFTPPERLTPRELLDYYGGLYDQRRSTDDVLVDVGLASAADTHYENLSGGQQRRTCVGATLVNEPDLLFLDEPTTGIDPAGRRALWNVLEDLAAQGTTIFLTTHDMAEAEQLADRVGLLADGALVAVDEPHALVADYGGDQLLRVEGSFETVPDLDYPVELSDGVLSVTDVAPTAIGEVVADLEAAGASYESLTWTEPDLEDVYLALAGEDAGPSGRTEPAEAATREGES
ncbi:ABC transporter ATP-binding protein [Halobacteriales archaeon Cl-PHB]